MMFIDNAARASLAKSFTRKEEGARIVFEAVEKRRGLTFKPFSCECPHLATLQMVPAKPHSAQAAHKRAKSWGRGSFGFGRFLLGSLPWLCFH